FGQSQRSGSWKKSNKCKNCGQNLDQDFEFCPYCGKHV
ncbi:MAG: zinc-ribbon domain-containing protein, partial [Desulfobacterales bacterium]|nr:zinc-ribbon domain-containing protein [Desulfobacterales bacterium]